LRVRWHRAVVRVIGRLPEIDLFEIGLPHIQLVDGANDRAILEINAEGLRIHLQPRHIGADELPKRVEIAGPRLGVDAFMNPPRGVDHLERVVEANAQAAECQGNNVWIDREFAEFSGIVERDFLSVLALDKNWALARRFWRRIPLNSGGKFPKDSRRIWG
jgi:hypothetical protein